MAGTAAAAAAINFLLFMSLHCQRICRSEIELIVQLFDIIIAPETFDEFIHGVHCLPGKNESSAAIKPGRSAGTRTLDPLIKSQLLYQLSYRPEKCSAKLHFFGLDWHTWHTIV